MVKNKPNKPTPQGKYQFTRKYRAWYSTLPSSLQLVGLQLWMPLFFTAMFCLCYLFAFHAPKISDIPVAYVGQGAQAEKTATAIEKGLKGKIDISLYADTTHATEAVRHGDMAGAIEPDENGKLQVVIASAHQFQAASLVQQMLMPALSTQGSTPHIKDIAPLPSYDAFGTVAMYLMLVTCIGGYMVAMFIGMMGGPLRHRVRIGTLVATSLVFSLVVQLIAHGIGAIEGHFWTLLGVQWLWMFTIGIVSNGLSYFTGRFIAATAMTLFIFLSMPASGGAYPVYFLPELFQWLNHLVVGSGITEMFKHVLYGVGPGMGRGYAMLAAYAAIGFALTLVGKPYWERKRARRILAGETTMFMDAQAANRAHSLEVREQIFKDAGLELPEKLKKSPAKDATESNTHESTTDPLLSNDELERDE